MGAAEAGQTRPLPALPEPVLGSAAGENPPKVPRVSKKLNQVVAAEAQIKGATAAKVTQVHHLSDKEDLFKGLTKTYEPMDEAGERLPKDEKRVQVRVEEQIETAVEAWGELLDVTLAKDSANGLAVADVKVGDQVLLKDAPVVYLLFLEKRVQDFGAFATKLPVLDESHDWERDSQGLYRTKPVETHRTKKVQKPLVLLAPTVEHPGQAQIITEDETVGKYMTVHTSGAITRTRKRDILRRCEQLLRAVKEAREKANMTEAEDKSAAGILDFVFKSKETV